MKVYTLPFPAFSVSSGATVPRTLGRVKAPASGILTLLGVVIAQQASEVSEQLQIELRRVSATTEGTRSTMTDTEIPKAELTDPTSLAVWDYNFSAEPTTYDAQALWQDAFNIVQGWQFSPQAFGLNIILKGGATPERIGLRLMNSPGQTLTIVGQIVVGVVG